MPSVEKIRNTPIVTAGGVPVEFTGSDGKARSIVARDPDGFFIEILQPETLPTSNAPSNSNIVGARFGLTVADMDQTMELYRDMLGFRPQIDAAFSSEKAQLALFNTSGAQIRRATAQVPGSVLQVEFVEFKGVDRQPIGVRIQDSGATRLQLRVRDTDAAVKTLTAAGGTVITTGGNGGPIDMRGLRVALVREFNNLFLVLMK